METNNRTRFVEGLDNLHRPAAQFRVVCACIVPPLLVILCPAVLRIMLSSLGLVTQQRGPVLIVAASLLLFCYRKIRSLARTKASYDLSMKKNRFRLPMSAIVISLVVCKCLEFVLDPLVASLQFLIPSFLLAQPPPLFMLATKVAMVMASVGLVVGARFVGFGFMRASLCPQKKIRFGLALPIPEYLMILLDPRLSRLPPQKQKLQTTDRVPSYQFTRPRPSHVLIHSLFVLVGTQLVVRIGVLGSSIRMPWVHLVVASFPVFLVNAAFALMHHEADPTCSWSNLMGRKLYLQLLLSLTFSAAMYFLRYMMLGGSPTTWSIVSLLLGSFLTCYAVCLEGVIHTALFSPKSLSLPVSPVPMDDGEFSLRGLLNDQSVAERVWKQKKLNGNVESIAATELSQNGKLAAIEKDWILNDPFARTLEDEVFWLEVLDRILCNIKLSKTRKPANPAEYFYGKNDCAYPMVRGLCIFLGSYGLAVKQWAQQKRQERLSLSPTQMSLTVCERTIQALQHAFSGDNSSAVISLGPSALKALHVLHQGATDMEEGISPWQEIATYCETTGRVIKDRTQREFAVKHVLDAECLQWLQSSPSR